MDRKVRHGSASAPMSPLHRSFVPGDTTATLQQDIIVGRRESQSGSYQVEIGIVFGHIGDSYEWHITNIGRHTPYHSLADYRVQPNYRMACFSLRAWKKMAADTKDFP